MIKSFKKKLIKWRLKEQCKEPMQKWVGSLKREATCSIGYPN
jgi:hypothetical protein